MKTNNRLVWIDLEMTGLDPAKDVILEIATLITDNDLNIIASGPELVIHQPESALAGMSDEVRALHKKSGLVERVKASVVSVREAERQTFEFIKEHCDPDTAPLCGNSVWQDKNFLSAGMPSIVDYLHYRILDVTAIKQVVTRWYADDPKAIFKKADTHRALADIKESIAELAYYRQNYFRA